MGHASGRKKITKSRQSASPRTLDRWQVRVRRALEYVNQLRELRGPYFASSIIERLGAELDGLLRSLGRAKRR